MRGDQHVADVAADPAQPALVVSHGRALIVLAVEIDGWWPRRPCDGVIEFVPQVGDFVAADEPLSALWRCGNDDSALARRRFGSERTMEQDPMFSFRILVTSR